MEYGHRSAPELKWKSNPKRKGEKWQDQQKQTTHGKHLGMGKTNKPREEPRYISAEIKVGATVRVRSASGMTGKSAYMGAVG